jgi:predicted polyphosphate/ATP-dependent NAD kinase
MSFNKWALIYLGEGNEDPAVDRAVITTGGLTTTIVAVPDAATATRLAKELVDDGAQSIEVCGGLGPAAVVDIVAATGGRVPVGGVTYGVESIHALAALFPQSNG